MRYDVISFVNSIVQNMKPVNYDQNFLLDHDFVSQNRVIELNLPRQSGKTTAILDLFNPHSDILITKNVACADYFLHEYLDKNGTNHWFPSASSLPIYTQSSIKNLFLGKRNTPRRFVFLDEVMWDYSLYENLKYSNSVDLTTVYVSLVTRKL